MVYDTCVPARIISRPLCELISRVLEKIERIHNMPRKAEHLSFQGKKDFENRSMGYGDISFFVQLLRFCPCGALYEKSGKRVSLKKCKK